MIDGHKRGYNQINPSLERIFYIMVDKDLDKIVDYCVEVYEKSLELEKKRLQEIRKELGMPISKSKSKRSKPTLKTQ